MNSQPIFGPGLAVSTLVCAWTLMGRPAIAAPEPAKAPASAGVTAEPAPAPAHVSNPVCVRRAEVDLAGYRYAICSAGYSMPGMGSDELQIIQLDGLREMNLVDRQRIEGQFRGLYVHGDGVWLETLDISARRIGPPVAGLPAMPPVQATRVDVPPAAGVVGPGAAPNPAITSEPTLATTPPSGATPRRVAQVTAVSGAQAVIDIGHEESLNEGADIAFYRSVKVTLGSEVGGREQVLVGHGVVVGLGAHHARVRIDNNRSLELGDQAQVAESHVRHYPIAPPRVPGSWDLQAAIRPLLALGNTGGGALLDASVQYHFRTPLVVELSVDPLHFAGGEIGARYQIGAKALFGLDLSAFGISLGVGVLAYRGESWTNNGVRRSYDAAMPTLIQSARIGASDGLALFVRSTIGINDGDFELTDFSARMQIPLSPKYWLEIGGGGGSTNTAHGDVGLRFLLRGNGSKGSLFMTPMAGFGGFGNYIGPTIGLSVQGRR